MSIARRVRRDGSVGYQVRVSVAGRRLPAEPFSTHREARRREAELITKRRGANTAELADRFAERWPEDFPIVKSGPTRGRRKSERTNRTYIERLEPFVREFRGVALGDVDRLRAVTFARSHPASAVVARGMFQDAVDAGLVDVNPFSRLNIEESTGRRDHEPLTVEEFHRLADLSLDVHGPEYGPHMRAMILFSGYVGPRLGRLPPSSGRGSTSPGSEVNFPCGEVRQGEDGAPAQGGHRGVALDAATPFRSKRGLPIRGRSAHYWFWNPVRAAFWATLSEHRRRAIVDLDWHSLRHFCGWYFYVHLDFSDELTAYQLGHSDAKLVRELYGHGRADALQRLKRGARVEVRPIRDTSLPHAAGESA